MRLNPGDLLIQLDPQGVRVLKRRLISGQITPRLFKDILKRQMVRDYFQSHPHPVMESWFSRQPGSSPRKVSPRSSRRPSPQGSFEEIHHKHF